MPRRLAACAAALALLAAFVPGASAHHVEFPSELTGTLESLPDGSAPQPAGHDADLHSENMFLVANFDDGGTYRTGSDLAFWGSRMIAGNLPAGTNLGGFRVLDIGNPAAPVELGQFSCRSNQGDVSVWKSLVFVSVDSPVDRPECAGAAAAPTTQVTTGQAYEGIRVVSIADPANPRQLAFVDTECGSHTHTLVPDEANDRILLYVLSYPLTPVGTDCNVETHRQISVVEVPLRNPAAARVIGTPDVSPAIGCHDVTVFTGRKLAAAACITESQMWDISNPAQPRVIAHIANPGINIHHSTTFTWDGDTIVIGDELGGAAVAPGCLDGHEHLPLGALWFYDVSDPTAPGLLGTYSIPQVEASTLCTAHNFNTVPTRTGADVLVSAWYDGGTTVIDFSNPAAARQLGFYTAKAPRPATTWSSYWYRGFIYANNYENGVQSRGIDVMAIGDPLLKGAIKVNRLNPQTMEPLPQQ
ncbi:MAG TPA: hypothetical protein VFK54_12505 [Candidatus Limnocylindrales bacterium]|nr:hypothetical protein [Candidatus Limnocylindrales bacterium]